MPLPLGLFQLALADEVEMPLLKLVQRDRILVRVTDPCDRILFYLHPTAATLLAVCLTELFRLELMAVNRASFYCLPPFLDWSMDSWTRSLSFCLSATNLLMLSSVSLILRVIVPSCAIVEITLLKGTAEVEAFLRAKRLQPNIFTL